MFTFLHAADIHLDSPLIGLERYGDAPVAELRGASRRAFENLIDVAIDEHVAFVVLAGDLFDGDWKDYNTGLFFAKQMAKLKESGITVFVVAGNHDAANQFSKSLRTPENVRRFPTGRAETLELGEYDVALHGRSFATKVVNEDLAATFPATLAGRFNIGVLHTSLNGREGHAPYAPCSVDGLRSKHYEYWALGHVHKREEVWRDPWMVFPGNIQGRHIREIGRKGCTLVTVADGEVADVRERYLDVLRWSHCRVDVSGVATLEASLARVGDALQQEVRDADDLLVAVRIELCGDTAAHAALVGHPEHLEQEIRALAVDKCGEAVWIEKVVLSVLPERGAGVYAASNEALAGLLGAIGDVKVDDDALVKKLAAEFVELRGKLPLEIVGEDAADPFDPTSAVVLKGVIERARQLILARLGSAEK